MTTTLTRHARLIALLIALPALSACASVLAQAIGVPGSLRPASEIPAGSYRLDPTHAGLSFTVNHLGLADYQGRFDRLSGTLDLDPLAPENSLVAITVEAASISTPSPALNDLLRGEDWFDVDTHPEIGFVSEAVRPTGPHTAEIDGQVTLLGVTRPVTLSASYVGAGTSPFSGKFTVAFEATGTLRRSDFGLDTLLPAVGDRVELLIAVEFLKES